MDFFETQCILYLNYILTVFRILQKQNTLYETSVCGRLYSVGVGSIRQWQLPLAVTKGSTWFTH